MKPLILKMGAFGCYANEEILDFTKLGGNGLYLITGETGSGKTTIFDAISYALFGKASGIARNNFKMLRSDYADERTKTFVDLSFSSDEKAYRIYREITPHVSRSTGEVSYTVNVSLHLPDGTVFERGSEVDAKIIEIIGLDRDQFTQIIMIAQNDFLRFLQSGTDDRVKILRHIFDTEMLKRFQENLKIGAKSKDDERKAVIRDFEKYNVDHNNSKQQFEQWKIEIETYNKEIICYDEKLKEYDKEKEGLTVQIAKAETICKIFEDLATQQTALEEHNTKVDEMSILSQRKERGEIALHKVKNIADNYAEAATSYHKAHSDYESAKSDIVIAEQALQLAEKVISELPPLEETQSSFDKLKDTWKASFDKMKKLSFLDANFRSITEKQLELDAANTELKKVDAIIENLPSIDKTKENLDKLTMKLEKENDKLLKLTSLQEEYNIIIGKQNKLILCQDEYDTLLETISKLPSLDDAKKQFEQLERDIKDVNQELITLTTLQSNWNDITTKQQQLKAKQAELESLNSNYDILKRSYDELHEQFILGQAGLLAKTLREGEPCPVCGSSKHPALAKAPEGDVSDAKLKELLSVSDEAKQKADQQSTECASLITTIKLLFDQFNTAATVYFQTNTDENIGDLITSKLLKAKAYSQELFEKKSRDEISLANLTCETENAAKRKTELEPEYNALQVEVTTLKVKFMKDITVFLSIALWENVGTLLFELLTNTQTSVEDLKAKRSADDKALTELKEKWENATKSQKDLKTTSTALHSSISTLVRSFLTDFSEYIPDVIWDSAGEKLSVLLDETTAQFSDLTEKKNVDEVILAELKAHWETAKSDRINYNTELEKKKSSKDEREKHEKNCFKKYEETQKLFISALSNNGFENEKDYSASLISEEELSDISKQITDFEENGKQIKIEIKRLKKETENKEKPDLDKLKFDLNEIKNASEALRIDRDEINLQLDNKKRILKELTKSAEDLVKIERAYATIKSLSDTANGKLDFETYAQMTYFERVLRAANQRLKVMSQNRYVLLRKNENDDGRKRMGLEIEVADSYTGKSRSANTLSGGESFMASLSLALGLSDVVQQSTGGIRLDAMFIDEGFGSLDADVLELSIRTLSDMADGNRIIGIISHVAELRERIDKQVYVEKTKGGSKIRLVV